MKSVLSAALFLVSLAPAWANPSLEGSGGAAVIRDGISTLLELEQNPKEVMTAQLVAKVQTLTQRAGIGMINPDRYLQPSLRESQEAAQLLERALEVYLVLKADQTAEGQNRAQRMASSIQDTRIERRTTLETQNRAKLATDSTAQVALITDQEPDQHLIHYYSPALLAAMSEREQRLVAYHAYLVASGSSGAEARQEVQRLAQPIKCAKPSPL